MSFFQGLALGVKYFYKLNPDFLLEVINDYLVYAPTEVCIIIAVRFLFVLFFSNKLPSDFHGRLRVQTPEGEKLRVFKISDKNELQAVMTSAKCLYRTLSGAKSRTTASSAP